jgi:hypothetical protein
MVSSSSPKALRITVSIRSSRLVSFGLLVSETVCSESGIKLGVVIVGLAAITYLLLWLMRPAVLRSSKVGNPIQQLCFCRTGLSSAKIERSLRRYQRRLSGGHLPFHLRKVSRVSRTSASTASCYFSFSDFPTYGDFRPNFGFPDTRSRANRAQVVDCALNRSVTQCTGAQLTLN